MRVATAVPVSVDLEDGFSHDPHEVADLVATLRELGVAGINIEDGTGAPELLVEKIAAIKRTLRERGDDIFVNARADVLLRDLASGESALRESIARAQRYLAAGADGIFVPMLRDRDDIRTVAGAVAAPLNILAVSGLPSLAELYALGVRRLSAGSGISKVAYGAALSAARAFVHDEQRDRMVFSPANADYSAMNALLSR
jgi:2-methylisocitrate lyase-like PEP mutase family enzyme